MEKIIFGITGLPGSGKTELSTLLKKKKFHVIEMGSVVRKLMAKQHVLPSDSLAFRTKLRKKYGMDVMAKETIKTLGKSNFNRLAIIGIRSTYEINTLKKHYRNFHVIAIIAPERVRFLRLKKRNRPTDSKALTPEDPKKFREFKYREKIEDSWGGSAKAQAAADFILINTSTFQDLEKNLDEIISKI